MLRGRVLTRAGEPISGAEVHVHHHPEFGSTLSDDQGAFDLAEIERIRTSTRGERVE